MLARRYVRKLRLADGAPPTLLAIAPGPGMLVVHSWADLGLHVFSINGAHLVSCAGSERLSALAVSPTGHFLLTGGLRGVVSLLWLHSLEVSEPAVAVAALSFVVGPRSCCALAVVNSCV